VLRASFLQLEFDRVVCPDPVIFDPVKGSAMTFSFTVAFDLQGQAHEQGHPLHGKACSLELLTDAFVCAKKAEADAAAMGGVEQWYSLYVDDFLTLILRDRCLDTAGLAIPLLQNLVNVMTPRGPSGCNTQIADYDRHYARLAHLGRTLQHTLVPEVEPQGLPFHKSVLPETLDLQAADLRIGCLLPVTLPHEGRLLRAQARTFLRHCDWTKAFYAAERRNAGLDRELARGIQGVELINLKQFEQVAGAAMLPDRSFQGGWRTSGRGTKAEAFSANTIQKVLYMLVYTAGLHLDDADVFCRLDLDTLFLADNFRAYLRVHGVSPDDAVFFGTMQTFFRYSGFGDFPDGGAGICLTRATLRSVAGVLSHRAILRKSRSAAEVERELALGDLISSGALPISEWGLGACDFHPGHFDDIVLGACFQRLGIRCHTCERDPFGRSFFTNALLPCREHFDVLVPERNFDAYAPYWPPPAVGSVQYAKAIRKKWNFDIARFIPCEPEHMMKTPHWWMVPYAASFHGYKNASHLLEVYSLVRTARARGDRVADLTRLGHCSKIVQPFDAYVILPGEGHEMHSELQLGDECWNAGCGKGGYCAKCGPANACCRDGFRADPSECESVAFFYPSARESHHCVEVSRRSA